MPRLLPLASLFAFCAVTAGAANVRLSKDTSNGYVSTYTLATGNAYTDNVLSECANARGRQNEPSVAVNPRDTRVIVGSSNDYCGVFQGNNPPAATGPIWLGYYRSQDGGSTFVSSLVPGYPGDTSPYASLAHIRTASSGDPVIAWDGHGRVYFGSESSDDPAGTKKTFGDEWVARFDNPDGPGGNTLKDGTRFLGSEIVAKGSSAPNLLGKFHDKTAIEADRTGGACDANVYFAWSRFTGAAGGSNIYFSRSTNQGASWSPPMNLTPDIKNVQDPDISVTGNGHVYVTFDMGATNSGQTDAIAIAKSVDCGKTFSKPVIVTTVAGYAVLDVATPQPVPTSSFLDEDSLGEGTKAAGSLSRDCGDFLDACQSGFTFFRRAWSPRSTADQYDPAHEWIYIVYDAAKPGTEADTGTTYGTSQPGRASQSGVYFLRYDGVTGSVSQKRLLDDRAVGHQFFADISADGGVLHALWWDSRNDPAYSVTRPIGNDAAGNTTPSLDVYATRSNDRGATWTTPVRVTEVSSNGNYEQFDGRSVPFAGDYLWLTSFGDFAFGAWTDWRNTVAGPDPRESTPSNADVKQCRVLDPVTGWGPDTCPRDGGLDQDIFGAAVP
jgi:hypothetical protein